MKKFVKVHVQLADYKMKLMKESYEEGRPFTRALMLHFPEDATVRAVIDEFLLGENILMAPIFGSNQTKR